MRTCLTLALAALLVAASVPLTAADWPAYRGPDRTGVSRETGLLKTWPKDGPKLLWQSDKGGKGYAGLAVVGGATYTMGARGKDEYLIALDDKGQEKWATKIGPVHDWSANSWSYGPNATPTVDGDLIFALSSRGMLLCAGRDGGEKWKVDMLGKLGGQVNPIQGGYDEGGVFLGWGYTWSPLVDGDAVIVTPGGPNGLFAALDKKTGTVRWRSKAVTDQATYASPVVATIDGTKQYVTQTQKGLVGVSAKDGELLWQHDRADEYDDVVCPAPIVKGNLVYMSVGTSGGSAEVVKVTGAGGKFKAARVWSNKRLNNYHSGVILVEDHAYGFHDARTPHWVCQELATGNVAWPAKMPARPQKQGGMVFADGRFYVLEDTGSSAPGTVMMFDASPKAFKVVSRFTLPAASKQRKSRGGVWAHPSLSDGKLYVRDQELVFCYQVK
jgi:outer membrane protein assembly factor BamB